MYQQLASVRLKSGEEVEGGVVTGPDTEWRERIQQLLADKDEIWKWQLGQLLTREVGVDVRFYVLHRDGAPFSHVLTATVQGVGLLGHVWTQPEDRGQGAASLLMDLVHGHFLKYGGQALFLSTGYARPPFHIYCKSGFEGTEPRSGVMHFFATSEEEFIREYFAPGETVIEPLDWPHWASAPALFTGDWPEIVRCTPYGLFGRRIPEKPLLVPLREREEKQATRALALRKVDNGALVGLAAWQFDPIWPETCLADVFCHPHFQDQASPLFAGLEFDPRFRIRAYADNGDTSKAEFLEAAGFQLKTTLSQWLAADVAETRFLDVNLFECAAGAFG